MTTLTMYNQFINIHLTSLTVRKPKMATGSNTADLDFSDLTGGDHEDGEEGDPGTSHHNEGELALKQRSV